MQALEQAWVWPRILLGDWSQRMMQSATVWCRRGAQILEEVIKFRWGALPDEQREGIRNYVSNLIIKLSSDEAAFRRERVFLNKLNIILVQVRSRP